MNPIRTIVITIKRILRMNVERIFQRFGDVQGFHRYFKNTAWMVSEKLLRIFFALFVGVWIARYLGPAEFGILSYVLAVGGVLGSIAKLGLDNIVVRELVLRPGQRDSYLGTTFWLKIAGALMVLTLVLAALETASNHVTTNFYILIVSLCFIFQAFETIEFYFQSKVLAKYVSICKTIQLVLSSILKIYLIYTEASLLWFILVALLDSITLAVTLLLAYGARINLSFLRCFDHKTATKMLLDAWPLMASSIAIMLYMRIDQIMIKQILGAHDVGIYSAALKLSEAWYFLPVAIAASLFPAIVNAKKISAELYRERMRNLYLLMIFLSVGIAFPTTLLSSSIINFLYGEIYYEAASVLVIHIWAGVFVFLGVASNKWLINEGLQIISFWRALSGLMVNVILNLILIPGYGVKGAAIATLVSQCCAAYLFDFFNAKTRDMFWIKTAAFIPLNYFRRVD